jgi:peptidyl-tRNA hydrolase
MKRNKLNSVWKEYCFILQDELEDTKGAIRICISKKNKQHNGQKENVHNELTYEEN